MRGGNLHRTCIRPSPSAISLRSICLCPLPVKNGERGFRASPLPVLTGRGRRTIDPGLDPGEMDGGEGRHPRRCEWLPLSWPGRVDDVTGSLSPWIRAADNRAVFASAVCDARVTAMGKIEDIKRSIEELAPGEVAKLRAWLDELDERLFDEKLARDVDAGKLDKLMAGARANRKAGVGDEL